jgi:hypothetical protein
MPPMVIPPVPWRVCQEKHYILVDCLSPTRYVPELVSVYAYGWRKLSHFSPQPS